MRRNCPLSSALAIIGKGSPMSMWRWRKVHVADIPKADRDLLQRFGENVVSMAVAGGFAIQDAELRDFFRKMTEDPRRPSVAAEWLTERGDMRLRREDRFEAVEVAILVVAALTFIVAAFTFAVAMGWHPSVDPRASAMSCLLDCGARA